MARLGDDKRDSWCCCFGDCQAQQTYPGDEIMGDGNDGFRGVDMAHYSSRGGYTYTTPANDEALRKRGVPLPSDPPDFLVF